MNRRYISFNNFKSILKIEWLWNVKTLKLLEIVFYLTVKLIFPLKPFFFVVFWKMYNLTFVPHINKQKFGFYFLLVHYSSGLYFIIIIIILSILFLFKKIKTFRKYFTLWNCLVYVRFGKTNIIRIYQFTENVIDSRFII